MADIITGLIVFVFISVVQGGEWCTGQSTYWFDYSEETVWCEHGCCGENNDRHCCLSETIIGTVIGSLFFIGFVASVIVFICCFFKRKRGRQRQVVTGQGVGTTVQMTTAQQPYMQQPYGQQPYMQQQGQWPYPNMPQPGQGPYPNMPQPDQGPYPNMPQPGQGPYPNMPQPGCEPPKYSKVVNPQ